MGYCNLGNMKVKAVQTIQSKSASVKVDGALNLQDYAVVCPGHNHRVHSVPITTIGFKDSRVSLGV